MKPLDKLKELLIAEQKAKYPNTPYHYANTFDTKLNPKRKRKNEYKSSVN
jgi:hypothetical protein